MKKYLLSSRLFGASSKNDKTLRSRKLKLEALESRELLSATTWEDASEVAAQIAVAQDVVAPIDLSNAELDNAIVVTSTGDSADTEGTLRYALLNAEAGATIKFDESLKGQTITLSGSELTIDKSVTIDASDLYDAETATPGITIDGARLSRVFNISGSDTEVSFNGLTIANGDTTEEEASKNGAGVLLTDASLTIVDSVFTGNYGGSNTNVGSNGGSIYANNATLTVDNSLFDNNYALTSSAGINTYRATAVVTNTTFTNNSSRYGCGMYVYGGNVTIDGCLFDGNETSELTKSMGGAGLYATANANNPTVVRVSNSTFQNNKSIVQGGALYVLNAQVDIELTNCVIVDNSASTLGGAIYNWRSTLNLVNCTVANNSSLSGAGILNKAGVINAYNSIIANNGSSDLADDSDDTTAESFNSYNTLSSFANWTNTDADDYVAYAYDSTLPLFAEGGYQLADDSQAADKGDNAYVVATTDIAGNARIQGEYVDLGAYEAEYVQNPESPSTVVTIVDDVVDEYDGEISLREAILYAADGDTITFAESLKGQAIVLDAQELVIDKSVTIDASALYNAETATPGITIDGDRKSRVLNISGAETQVQLLGLTIANGDTTEETNKNGAGVLLTDASLTIVDSVFTGNYGGSNGGSIYANNATLTVDNSLFDNNYALTSSAGINTYRATAVVTNTTFTNNSSRYGCGMYVYGGNVTIDGCLFDGNETSELTKSMGGAGLYATANANNPTVVRVSNSTFQNNKSIVQGGALYVLNAQVDIELTNCVIVDNSASTLGGAIYNWRSTLNLVNCTVANNSSLSGAGILNKAGVINAYNSIIANNGSSDLADDSDDTTAESFNSYNTLSSFANWTNTDADDYVAYAYDSTLPLFAEGGYQLADDSQAADKGDNAYVVATTDIAGNARIQGEYVDLGAYEAEYVQNPESPSTVVTIVDDVVDEYDGEISLREAILYAADGDTITFAESLKGQAIVLDAQELVIDKSVTIDASALYNAETATPGITIDGDRKSRVLNISGAETQVQLLGLTIANGDTTEETNKNGAGVLLTDASLTIVDSVFTGNYGGSNTNVGSNGGSIYANNATLTVDNSLFDNNYALTSSAGINTYRATAVVTNTTFTNNSSRYGCGMYVYGGNVTIDGCLFDGNETSELTKSMGGAGLYATANANNPTVVRVSNSTFQNNKSIVQGGALYVLNAQVDIE
ncbi:MAG: right-handed parallel beta-helix repeat-containing protein, partial [Planctomycetia bacterium]|nr:right-handed parallel beta-helix repeat-containing protein [Planctomycetia bacterium]